MRESEKVREIEAEIDIERWVEIDRERDEY